MNTIKNVLIIQHKTKMKKEYIKECKENNLKVNLELFEEYAKATLGY